MSLCLVWFIFTGFDIVQAHRGLLFAGFSSIVVVSSTPTTSWRMVARRDTWTLDVRLLLLSDVGESSTSSRVAIKRNQASFQRGREHDCTCRGSGWRNSPFSTVSMPVIKAACSSASFHSDQLLAPWSWGTWSKCCSWLELAAASSLTAGSDKASRTIVLKQASDHFASGISGKLRRWGGVLQIAQIDWSTKKVVSAAQSSTSVTSNFSKAHNLCWSSERMQIQITMSCRSVCMLCTKDGHAR